MTEKIELLAEHGVPPLQPDFMAKWATMITGLPNEGTCTALQDFGRERIAQHEKWGEQNHPDGTSEEYAWIADAYRAVTQENAAKGTVTWHDILLEEVFEAMAEEDPVKLRKELVQAGAVIAAWIESMDRRGTQETLFDV